MIEERGIKRRLKIACAEKRRRSSFLYVITPDLGEAAGAYRIRHKGTATPRRSLAASRC
jgi:hypothetical protein